LLKVSNLSVQFTSSTKLRVLALDNVSLQVPLQGYTLGVVGESGSGKTTLGLSLMNLIEPPGKVINGDVDYMGRNVLKMDYHTLRRYRWEMVSMVFQSAMNSLNPVKTVVDHVSEVIREHKPVTKQEARERAMQLLNEVGIKSNRVSSFPHEFSGGMRQRAVIAMALALSPKLLIADEPTSALDVVVQRQILALLRKEVLEKQLSLVFITHEIALLNGLVEQVAVMFAGEIVEQGPTSLTLSDPLHPYTEMLLHSILSLDSDRSAVLKTPEKKTEEILVAQRVGCKFAGRCVYAFNRCRTEKPILKQAQSGRWVSCHKYNS
jgi:peptide/nickel transport system ATP-binding protein